MTTQPFPKVKKWFLVFRIFVYVLLGILGWIFIRGWPDSLNSDYWLRFLKGKKIVSSSAVSERRQESRQVTESVPTTPERGRRADDYRDVSPAVSYTHLDVYKRQRFGWTFGGYWGTIEREWKEPFPPQDLMQWNFSPFHSQLSDVGKEWATAHFCKSILESPGRWNAFAFAGLSALQSSARYSRDLFLETLKTGIDIPFYSEEGEPARYQTFSIVAVLEAFWPANTNWVSLLTLSLIHI